VPSAAVVPVAGAAVVAAGAGDAAPDPAAAVVAAPGGGAINDWPHDGHVIQAGSSMILRQFWQRFGANGSSWPQYGQAATARSMNLSQYGHGCL
jgi:hypothetical protein